jgi:hypothetical protein
MIGVLDRHTTSAPASEPWVRTLVACVLAMVLVTAPAVGVAWPDVSSGDAATPGAVAGVVPLVADPGHRMGGASSASAGGQGVDPSFVRSSRPDAERPIVSAAPTTWPSHAWLDRMLIGAQLQTDGG